MRKLGSERLTGIIATIAVHLVILLVLVFSFLRYPPADRDPLEFQDQHAEITFEEVTDLLAGGDIVALGDNLDDGLSEKPAPASETAEDPTQDGLSLDNAGEAATPSPMLAAEQESPVVVVEKPVPEETGPTKEELEAAAEAKRQQQMRQNIADRTRFGSGSTGDGAKGDINGNAAASAAGSPSVEGLAGYTLQNFSKVRSTSIGTIAINVTVEVDGTVSEASFNASKSLNTARTDKALIERCRQSALKSRFSVPANTVRRRTGIILYHFK